MEFDMRVTIGDLGSDPADGERMLECLLEAAPTSGPVVAQDRVTDTLTAAFSCDAADATAAKALADDLMRRAVIGKRVAPAIAVRADTSRAI